MARKKKEAEENVDVQNEQQTTEETVENQEETAETQEEATTEKTIEDEYAELKDKYVRLYSDFDNFRKRTIKEKADIIGSASAGIMKELLAVLDDFERAIANNEKADDIDNIKEGFKLIHHKLNNILQAKGLESMDAKGEVFDPEKHEAITNIPAQSDEDKGKVMDVIERGYNLNGKPLRYAKVVVGQ
ncbi:MAG: nucleotide exchange factor GrpE [Flavobacteriales bacterium]|nr:nucleotide exchange factor GrpE [Flavobacteriales bacterium]